MREVFTDADKHILLAMNSLERQNKPVTPEGIRDYVGWTTWKKDLPAISVTLECLLERRLVTRGENVLSLTGEGRSRAREFDGEGFGKWMIGCEESPSYRKFCQRLYGIDRCQFDMMTQMQFEKLLEVLRIRQGEKVLDLGCSTGSIPLAIAEATGAHVLGVDFSANAIHFAQEKTRQKRKVVKFQVIDMDALNFPPKSFDVVIAVDTLYFVRDISLTIQALKNCLGDAGRMGIFYTCRLSEGEPQEMLLPERTPLAKALLDSSLGFETWDFTTDERGVWEKSIIAAEELRGEFEAEGEPGILDDRVYEAEENLTLFRTSSAARYLYHAHPSVGEE